MVNHDGTSVGADLKAEIERLRDALQANRTAKAVAVAAANAERDEALALLDQLGYTEAIRALFDKEPQVPTQEKER